MIERAAELARLHSLIVAQDGQPVIEQAFRGGGLDDPANVKSVAKTFIAALVGAAIERGVLEGVDQPVATVLGEDMPDDADPRVETITVENLLTMQAGLERTSGDNYGRWAESPNWVQYALSRPFVDEPGGQMLYSTGSSHLLSAMLTEASGESTLALAREWIGEPLGIEIPAWHQDPQGIYLGGNNMALSPRALLRFGEMYRNGGVFEGERVLPESWVRASFVPQTRSQLSGHGYGYGWFITEMAGRPVYYGWGYGGQMLYLVPSLDLTVVMTSDPNVPSGRSGYVDELHELLAEAIIPAAEGSAAASVSGDPPTGG